MERILTGKITSTLKKDRHHHSLSFPSLHRPSPCDHLVLAQTEDRHKDNQKAGAPLLCRQAERIGVVQLLEEKVPGRPYKSLPAPKGEGGLQESWRGTFEKGM